MDFEKEINEIKRTLSELQKKRINNIATGLEVIASGTINSGDTTTDTVIEDLRTGFNKLKSNIEGQ